MVQCLSYKQEILSSNPSTTKQIDCVRREGGQEDGGGERRETVP
jgi:uncharacterized protein (UPF0262 family)